MTKVTIDRELLERVAKPVLFRSNEDAHADACAELRAILAAPRQPEDDLEVVAWQDAENPLYTTSERRVLHDWANNGYPIVELCRLSDAQRAIAELRGLTPELPPRPPEGEGMPRYGLRWNGPQQPVAVPMADGYWTPWHLAETERDAQRAIAERDAEIMEQCRLNGMGAERELKLMTQRDKLAGLLRRSAAHVRASAGASHMMEGFKPRRNKLDELSDEIDAALAEVNK